MLREETETGHMSGHASGQTGHNGTLRSLDNGTSAGIYIFDISPDVPVASGGTR